MRFDWYAATIPDTFESLIFALSQVLKAEARPTRGLYGYKQGMELLSGGVVVARLLGESASASPHAWASGFNTPVLAEAVRGHWPRHSVSRVDVCEDFDEVGCWDRISREVTAIAKEGGYRLTQYGDFLRGVRGRTLYLGSRYSSCYVRVYEKGKQLIEQQGGQDNETSRNWVRVEAQIRPEKNNRERASVATPQALWGFNRLTRLVAGRVLKIFPAKVTLEAHHSSSDELALRWLAHQYGKVLERLYVKEKSWDAVGVYLSKLIAENAAG